VAIYDMLHHGDISKHLNKNVDSSLTLWGIPKECNKHHFGAGVAVRLSVYFGHGEEGKGISVSQLLHSLGVITTELIFIICSDMF
jgi:hypothetical protein